MHTRTSSLAFVTAALSAFLFQPGCATPQTSSVARAHAVDRVDRFENTVVIRGMAALDVLKSLGSPRRTLGDDIWLYPGFDGGWAQAPEDDCRTLMLIFNDGRVRDIQLVNERTVGVVAARIESMTNPKELVATAH